MRHLGKPLTMHLRWFVGSVINLLKSEYETRRPVRLRAPLLHVIRHFKLECMATLLESWMCLRVLGFHPQSLVKRRSVKLVGIVYHVVGHLLRYAMVLHIKKPVIAQRNIQQVKLFFIVSFKLFHINYGCTERDFVLNR